MWHNICFGTHTLGISRLEIQSVIPTVMMSSTAYVHLLDTSRKWSYTSVTINFTRWQILEPLTIFARNKTNAVECNTWFAFILCFLKKCDYTMLKAFSKNFYKKISWMVVHFVFAWKRGIFTSEKIYMIVVIRFVPKYMTSNYTIALITFKILRFEIDS